MSWAGTLLAVADLLEVEVPRSITKEVDVSFDQVGDGLRSCQFVPCRPTHWSQEEGLILPYVGLAPSLILGDPK